MSPAFALLRTPGTISSSSRICQSLQRPNLTPSSHRHLHPIRPAGRSMPQAAPFRVPVKKGIIVPWAGRAACC